jgi:hypothetical protein
VENSQPTDPESVKDTDPTATNEPADDEAAKVHGRSSATVQDGPAGVG